jgi:hypothetical protein
MNTYLDLKGPVITAGRESCSIRTLVSDGHQIGVIHSVLLLSTSYGLMGKLSAPLSHYHFLMELERPFIGTEFASSIIISTMELTVSRNAPFLRDPKRLTLSWLPSTGLLGKFIHNF